MIDVINPPTYDVTPGIENDSLKDSVSIMKQATIGARISSEYSKAQRAKVLNNAANIIESNLDDFAHTIVRDSRKTIIQARKEAARCVNTMRLSAEEAKRTHGEMIPFDSYEGNEQRFGYFTREPLGIILAITPYNDPLNLVAHKLGPAIAAGNSVILKPSKLTPLSAIKLVDALVEGGLHESIITIARGDSNLTRALVAEHHIRMISFTGGISTGEKIISAGGLKKYAMDLGGNAPVIVMKDADISDAVDSCVSGSFWASGQNCIGVQRILIDKNVYQEFESRFVEQTKKLIVGDPLSEKTDVGPMISEENAKIAEQKINDEINKGATLLVGNKRKDAFYSPTAITDVSAGANILKCEVFAPIVILESFDDIDDAIDRANDCDFALHAGLFTKDLDSALNISERLEAGGVMINDSSDFRFDGMPFGGFKYGSMGREGVRFSIEEMSQPKVVCINR